MTKEPCGKKQWLICNVSRINYNSFSIRKSSTRYIIYKTPKWVNHKKTAPRSGFSRLFLVGTKASKVKTGACYICLWLRGLRLLCGSGASRPLSGGLAVGVWRQSSRGCRGRARHTAQVSSARAHVWFPLGPPSAGPWAALCCFLQVGLGDLVPPGAQ